jgi:hypothetical protein
VIIVLTSVTALSSCTSVMRAISKSNVSSEELRSVLLQSADVPGWSIDPAIESSVSDSALAKLEDQVCDVDAAELGSTYTSTSGDLDVLSSAEPICGTGAESREATILAEDTYRQVYQEMMVAEAATEKFAVSDFSYTRVDLGLGNNTLVYLISAQLTGAEFSVSYEAYDVSIFSDRLAATVRMRGYDRVVPQDELLRLANVVKSRVLALG